MPFILLRNNIFHVFKLYKNSIMHASQNVQLQKIMSIFIQRDCKSLYFNPQSKSASINSHPCHPWVLPKFLHLYSFRLGIFLGVDLLVTGSCMFNFHINHQTIFKAITYLLLPEKSNILNPLLSISLPLGRTFH